MLNAAMRGELGPLAQAVAKYQVERKIHNEMDKLKALMEKKPKDIQAENKPNNENVSGVSSRVSDSTEFLPPSQL